MSQEILRLKQEEVRELVRRGEMEVVSTPERAREILGKDFLGVEAVKKLEAVLKEAGVNVSFVVDPLPRFRYTEEDLLVAKVFDEMLVLRPEEMIKDGVRHPITLIQFHELFAGKLAYIYKQDTETYKSDQWKLHRFAKNTAIKLGWVLVKKQVLNSSINACLLDQEDLLDQYMAVLEESRAKHCFVRRRTILEAMYDTLLCYVNTGGKLPSSIADLSDTVWDNGRITSLQFRPDGLALYNEGYREANPYVGVCPSRPANEVEVSNKSSIEKAQQIFGKDFFGPQQIEKTFGIKLPRDEASEIPFPQQELERAAELGQFLILRVNRASDGQPLTIQKMFNLFDISFKNEHSRKFLTSESFFMKDVPRTAWALVSKQLVPESTGKNYLDQTEALIRYLFTSLSSLNTIGFQRFYPKLSEYRSRVDTLSSHLTDPKELDRSLAALEINQETRHSPVEIYYDLLVYITNTGDRLFENISVWTSVCASNGQPIVVGQGQNHGVYFGNYENMKDISTVGVVFSRRI